MSVVELDGKLEDIKDFVHIDKMISETAAKVRPYLATNLTPSSPYLGPIQALSSP